MSSGLNDMIKKLDQMEKGAKSLEGTHSIPLSELCDQKFCLNTQVAISQI